MLSEIYKKLEGIDTMYFFDDVVKVRLQGTRDMHLEEIARLENMEKLSEWQKQDYEELSGDVIAITRVMKFYGFEENYDE